MIAVVWFAMFLVMDSDPLLWLLPAPQEGVKEYAGKVVWIIGASSGIGAGLAADFAKQGAQVVLSARRAAKLEAVADTCDAVTQGSAPRPGVVLLDVTDYERQTAAFEEVVSQYGKVDVLVLNAGWSQRGIAMETTLEETKDMFEINVFGLINMARIVVPTLDRGSKVVVMSSVAGKIGTPGSSTYSATKFAMNGYFDALRAELSRDGIDVLTVCPGPVVSEITAKSMRSPGVIISDEPGKMETQRCTDLVMKALHWGLDEIWVAKQPVLLVTYLNVYTPWFMRQAFTKFIGPARMNMLKNGGSMYDLKSNLGLK
jgi:dehydrogenase/reductase SDR family protein 7